MNLNPDLKEIEDRLLKYRTESGAPPLAGTTLLGLKHLLPMVDRHYYINLRSILDRRSGQLHRGLWMHFPHSYGPSWPNTEAMAKKIMSHLEVDGQGGASVRSDVDDINRAFRDTEKLHYHFREVQIIHSAIPALNDLTYTIDNLISTTNSYKTKLLDLFGPAGRRPEEYRKFFYEFERECIYSDWDSEKTWVYFPIFFRHLWVSLLVMRVPTRNLVELAQLLPLFSGAIGERLLSLHVHWGWGHPITAVTCEEELISLMSIVAAQCGLHKLAAAGGTITFEGGCASDSEPIRKYVRVPDGWRQFAFKLGTAENGQGIREFGSENYFDRLWRECRPVIMQFWNDIKNQSNVAKASIMSRNFSHNVGSHSLANPRLYKSLDIDGHDSAKMRLETFHGFAQGRLDFMARAMSTIDERSEPLFFVGDVLNGFFRQGVLLDTIVEDAGYAAKNLHFVVEIQSQKVTFDWAGSSIDEKIKESHSFVAPAESVIDDVLVGIPGGMVGCHALYAFLENCLRNAAKYANRRKTQNGSASSGLIFTIRLEKCKARRAKPEGEPASLDDAWILRLSDNVSVDTDLTGDFGVTAIIRQYINTPLLNREEGGRITSEGHGIQEMKVCAETLAGGEAGLRFGADEDQRPAACDDYCTTCAEYKNYLNAKPSTVPQIGLRQALRCYSYPVLEGQENFLVYNLLLPCPVLLGLVTLDNEVSETPPGLLPDFVRRFGLDDLANTGAQFGVILDSDGHSAVAETLSKIASLHKALPYRLMVVTNKAQVWRALLEKQEDGGFGRPDFRPFTHGQHIPNRRLHIIGNEDGLLTFLRNSETGPGCAYLGAEGWQAIVIRIYDAWLRAYKALPDGVDSWKVCIGFEHGGAPLAARWKRGMHYFSHANNPCISIHVVSYDKPPNKGGVPSREFSLNSPFNSSEGMPNVEALEQAKIVERRPATLSGKQILAFDNHGEMFERIAEPDVPLSESARFHQKIGLKDSLSLFQTLESPPGSPFPFAWLIYSLTEAALTTVVILDERVAQATLGALNEQAAGPERMFVDRERRYHKAGVFPLLSFRCGRDGGSGYHFISERIAQAARCTAEWREATLPKTVMAVAKEQWNYCWNGRASSQPPEGLTVGDTCCRVGAAMIEANGLEVTSLTDTDVLVIHEGVTDILERQGLWKPDGSEVDLLYTVTPCVVRTSGRGRETRHLQSQLPFLEFTELSENTYRSLNKYALCKALLSTTGVRTDDNDVLNTAKIG